MHQVRARATKESAVQQTSFKTLLVHVEPGLGSSHRVEAAARLAREFDAHLIGLAAETFSPPPAADPISTIAVAEWYGMMQGRLLEDLQAAEEGFHRDAFGIDQEWRSVKDYPARALAGFARAADLVLVGPKSDASATRRPDPAEVIMSAGRPVLVVPEGRNHLRGEAVAIGWKNTRECRRAVSDALPFLQRARHVVVLSVVAKEQVDVTRAETEDLLANLRRHGVHGYAHIILGDPHDAPRKLERAAMQEGADLIVAGAYGHTRLREWVFGGMTEHLLKNPKCFVLTSR